MSGKSKVVDFLFEDPPIANQKFALISIVGPHMQQKCDVWGIKIRGVADTKEKAIAMSRKLNNIDPDYDIYTTEVGKFFPLVVDPEEIQDQVHANAQLNEMIKTYKTNKEQANEHFFERKNQMIKEAVREGKNQEELANKPEHPVSVLYRIKNFEEKIKSIQEDLEAMTADLQLSKDKLTKYSEEELAAAKAELQNAVDNNLGVESAEQDPSVDEIRNTILADLDIGGTSTCSSSNRGDIERILGEIQVCEQELGEFEKLMMTLDKSSSPNLYAKLQKNMEETRANILKLRGKLNDNRTVNEYINSNYTGSSYDYLQKDPN